MIAERRVGVMDAQVTVVVPVHNEGVVVNSNVTTLRSRLDELDASYEILLVENGSSDNTLESLTQLSAKYPDVRHIAFPYPNLSEAIRRGIIEARSEKVVYYPIDLSVEFDFIPESVQLLDIFDVVVGSKRLIGDLDKRPLSRQITSKVYHGLVQQLYRVSMTDSTCVKAYRRSRILGILERVPTSSMIYETELLVEAEMEGLSIIEVPVEVIEHRPSRNSLRNKAGNKLRDLLSARLCGIALCIGIPITLIGLSSLGYLVVNKVFQASTGGFANPYTFLISVLMVITGFQIVAFGLLTNLILQIRREPGRPRDYR